MRDVPYWTAPMTLSKTPLERWLQARERPQAWRLSASKHAQAHAATAEVVEGRELAKGNTGKHNRVPDAGPGCPGTRACPPLIRRGVPIGWHLGAREHGQVGTGPARRAAARPLGLSAQRFAKRRRVPRGLAQELNIQV